ncbi:SPOR domain-containing protein [Amphibacillus cookii]|uniref:SPOR domain-containing protein n=1 Tax=Amphibacillus cookii TaxID=767787 RepID=UPI0019576CB7|nr:SPOR domain-containing protein [Amphibacillus cookii]MBM7541785.1 stage II sporulation protein B [Amphibacillus cookii]
MEKKKQISIKLSDQSKVSIDENLTKETAASLSDLDHYPPDVEPYTYGLHSSKKPIIKKTFWVKFIVTAFAAITIGMGFGMTFIYIFTGEKEEPAANQEPTHSFEDQENQSASTADLKVLDGLSAYVIQAGAFAMQEQAEQFQIDLSNRDYSAVVWQTDNDYRVFVGVYQSESEAKQAAERLDIDTYIREWQTDQYDMAVTDDEYQWLTSFSELWQQSLSGITEQVEQNWQQWLTVDHHAESEQVLQFHQQVEELLQEINSSQSTTLLIELWFIYDQLAS